MADAAAGLFLNVYPIYLYIYFKILSAIAATTNGSTANAASAAVTTTATTISYKTAAATAA